MTEFRPYTQAAPGLNQAPKRHTSSPTLMLQLTNYFELLPGCQEDILSSDLFKLKPKIYIKKTNVSLNRFKCSPRKWETKNNKKHTLTLVLKYFSQSLLMSLRGKAIIVVIEKELFWVKLYSQIFHVFHFSVVQQPDRVTRATSTLGRI